jgi:histidinol-phosphate/aromatic aminotransferase/cobyric acid decarboxylase-like protein
MLAPAERRHGGLAGLDAEARAALVGAERVADFSANLNPYGPPAALLESIQAAPLDAYPDAQAGLARAAWAEQLRSTPEHIAVGHGAADLFWAVCHAVLRPGDRAHVLEPTFSEFRLAAQACGASVGRTWLDARDGFRLPLERLIADAQGTRALYLCAPNNPTGTQLAPDQVLRLAHALPETLIVLDQSFLMLSDHADEAGLALPDNVASVRSLTKDFALAGLRIGLLWAAPSVVSAVERVRPTWSTSAPAQAAIARCAGLHGFVAESWSRLEADRAAVTRVLRAHHYEPLPSRTGYQLVPVGDAASFCQKLLLHGVVARDCSSFGLPEHVRLAARPPADVAQLERALAAL